MSPWPQPAHVQEFGPEHETKDYRRPAARCECYCHSSVVWQEIPFAECQIELPVADASPARHGEHQTMLLCIECRDARVESHEQTFDEYTGLGLGRAGGLW